MAKLAVIGKSVPRPDAPVKVTGDAIYTGDIKIAGMLTGKIKYSPHPFARIRSINTEKAKKLPGVEAVITAKDVVQHPFGVFIYDEYPLCSDYARYAGDEVAAVAAVDPDIAEEAVDLIEVDYEPLRPSLTVEQAMSPEALPLHPERKDVKNNITFHLDFNRGEGEAGFKEADFIIEDVFSTQPQHQTYLEPQACIAQWDTSGRLSLWGATQRIFTNAERLAMSLGIPKEKVRIITLYVGGGFGGKEEMFPYFPIAALLAKAAGKAVQLIFSREEDFISGRPRTSHDIRLRLGFKKDGTLVAKRGISNVNAGAYTGICPLIMKGSLTRADSLYRFHHIHITANLVYTNTIPRGAFRGFGDPQMHFAQESLIDMAAEQLGIDPIELKLKNAVHTGDVTNSGYILRSCGFSETLKLVRQKADWNKKRKNKVAKRGVGIACQFHNGGNKAIAKEWGYEGSAAVINVDQNGRIRVMNGEMEMGQGMLTIYAQITAETIGVPVEDIDILPYIDTDVSPFSLGSMGSRVTMMGGNAVLKAAKDTKRKLLRYASQRIGVKPSGLEIKDGKFYVKGSKEVADTVKDVARDTVLSKLQGVPINGRGDYLAPEWVVVPDETYYGNFSISWTFSSVVAEVSVDTETGQVDVLDIWHALDVGKVLNPGTAEGQVEGGAVMGVGYTLTEDYNWTGGVLRNPNFTDYKIPMAEGIPRIHSLWVEKPNPGSPFGAKAIGEHVLNPIAPAIANAIYDAVGIRVKSIPITPGKILNALKQKGKDS